jgi:hypothetical protein
MIIEIETGVFYDDTLTWVHQSAECIELGEQVVKDALTNETYEPDSTFTVITESVKRQEYLHIIYDSVSLAPKQFSFELNYHYAHNPEDSNWEYKGKKGFGAKIKITTVTVKEI